MDIMVEREEWGRACRDQQRNNLYRSVNDAKLPDDRNLRGNLPSVAFTEMLIMKI